MNKEENTKGTSRGKRMLFELMNAIMDLENYCEKLERENKHLNEQLDVALKDYDKQQAKINEAIDKLYCWGDVLNIKFQEEMSKILKED